jgi:uncharacterized protein (TIGR02996 family)
MTAEDFWKAVGEKPWDPSPKLAFADWLEEVGDEALSYALRYAGRRALHPYPSPLGRVYTWYCVDDTGRVAKLENRLSFSPFLPRTVYDSFRPRPLSLRTGVTSRTMTAAFEGLSRALNLARGDVEIPK